MSTFQVVLVPTICGGEWMIMGCERALHSPTLGVCRAPCAYANDFKGALQGARGLEAAHDVKESRHEAWLRAVQLFVALVSSMSAEGHELHRCRTREQEQL